MANPFTTFRAAEQAETIEGFLSLVVPEPLEQYFGQYFHDNVLFRRAIFVYGQPGSGKTTLARLFEPSALSTLLRIDSARAFSSVRIAVSRTGAISDKRCTILGARLPLESDFRDLANLPYTSEIKRQLLLRLIQARTVLRWFSQLQHIGISPDSVEAVARDGFDSSLDSVGGSNGTSFLARARSVENSIYSVLGALVPPDSSKFPEELLQPYNLFDILAEFRLESDVARNHNFEPRLRPFVILDDAHSLSSEQFYVLRHWVTRREITLGRWVLSRLDVLDPSEIATEFASNGEGDGAPGLTEQRDFNVVFLQGVVGDRVEIRRKFKNVAAAIGRQYIKQVEAFNRPHITDLASILVTKVTPIPDQRLSKWVSEIEKAIDERGITKAMRRTLEETADSILLQRRENSYDLRIALIRILVHRRSAIRQMTLFDTEEDEPVPRTIDTSLLGGAEIHLFRAFDRPYYYGFDQLSLASSENPELFVRMAGSLVDASLNLMIRRKGPSISAAEQHRLLRTKASDIIQSWNYPEVTNVRRLVTGIAARCEKATDQPNAYLKSGANALGIPMHEFDTIHRSNSPLAQTIKFGVAYSAFTITLHRSVKNKQWCLITLGGVACLHHGLTLALGGFVEGTASELSAMISG